MFSIISISPHSGHPFFILLNVAVGGTFGGNPTDGTTFPQTMYIDYVRAYKKNDNTLVIINTPSGNDGTTDDEGNTDNEGNTDEGGNTPNDEDNKENISSGGSINDWGSENGDKGPIYTEKQ